MYGLPVCGASKLCIFTNLVKTLEICLRFVYNKKQNDVRMGVRIMNEQLQSALELLDESRFSLFHVMLSALVPAEVLLESDPAVW